VYRICPFYDETLLEMRLADFGDPVDIALKGRVREILGDTLENAQIIYETLWAHFSVSIVFSGCMMMKNL
jgi:hypothetical protein